jgi:hypothetical protein
MKMKEAEDYRLVAVGGMRMMMKGLGLGLAG